VELHDRPFQWEIILAPFLSEANPDLWAKLERARQAMSDKES
jgi:hypothetical protein